MLRFLEEVRAVRGVLGEVMAELSSLLGTEQVFAQNDRQKAREGDGFLAVFSPNESTDRRVRDTVAPFRPVSMQKYSSGGIESMIPPRKTAGLEL